MEKQELLVREFDEKDHAICVRKSCMKEFQIGEEFFRIDRVKKEGKRYAYVYQLILLRGTLPSEDRFEGIDFSMPAYARGYAAAVGDVSGFMWESSFQNDED